MRTLLSFIILLHTLTAVSQSPVITSPLVLTHITEENGLSDNRITCVYKDREGFVWIGTKDGLNLMDGSNIRNFRHSVSDSTTISGNYISAITEDRMGNIFIGAANGLCHYDKKKGIFVTEPIAGSPYGNPGSIDAFVQGTNGDLWLGTAGGLFCYQSTSGKITAFYNSNTEHASLPGYSNNVLSMQKDDLGQLWLATRDGLWTFGMTSHLFKKIIHKDNAAFYQPLCQYVYKDHEGNMWAGFWQVGLKKIDPVTGIVKEYPTTDGHNISAITDLSQPGGHYALWLNGDLLAFDESSGNYFNLQQPPGEKKTFSVNPVFHSADGWIWLASDNGLYIYNPGRQVFGQQLFNYTLTTQGINYCPYKNALLVGAEGKDFLKLQDEHGKVLADYSQLSDPKESVLSIINAGGDDFWIGSSGGVLHANLATGNHQWYKHAEGDTNTLPRNFVTTVYIDSKQQLWVFPWRKGIWQMDRSNGRCKKMIEGFLPDGESTKGLLISSAAEDPNGNLWMTDLDEGVIRYDVSSKKFSKPFEKQLGARYLASNIFLKGKFAYARVANGLIKWDTENMQLSHFTLPQQMDKGLVDMYPDQKGNWWLAGNSGLIVFNEREGNFKRFTVADGLVKNNMDATLYCTPGNTMIIGAPEYFSYFDPERLIGASYNETKIILTGLLVNNRPVDGDTDKTIRLDHNENNVLIHWALPEYSNPLHNQYYVKLDGIDADWRYVGNIGEVQYANLSPGKYRVQLKASTANGVPSANTITLRFVIAPPFWKTWWFLLGCFLLTAGLLFFVISRRIKNIRARAAIRQQLGELEMKALRAQMNPHFIFNSLNSIQECIVSKNTDAAYDYLSQFSKLVRRILENSGKATVTLKEELELMQWYLKLEQLRFTNEFSFAVQNNCHNPQAEIPAMIIQPFIENALWHGLAHKPGEKILKLEVNDDANGISISIEDNGIGRKAAAALPQRPDKQSMGLAITKERLTNYSTASSIEINDLVDENGAARGTKVVIHLPFN